MLRRFDGIAEDGRQFLVNLQHEIRRNLFIQDWIETVWVQFTDQAFEWINNNKEMMIILDKESSDEVDKKRFIQLICEKYPVVRKPVVFCERYPIEKPVATKSVVTKSVVKKSVAVKVIHMQQGQDEIIREYYLRIHDALVATGDMNILLSSVIRHWINGLNNRKLARHLVSRSITEQSLYDVCIIAERKLRQKEERKLQKKAQVALQQQLQDFVDVSIARTQKSYESSSVLEETPCNLLEINVVVNNIDIESIDEVLASGSGKWIAVAAGKEVFDSISTLAGFSKNQHASHVESIDEVLASGPGKWIAAAAGKEVFGSTSTSHEAAKNPIEASDNSFGWSRCCTVDDVEVLNQEVFALAALYDAFLKNSPVEDMEISVAMDMSSLKHLMDMDGPAIEAFDSGTTLGAHSKNSSIQHTDDSETMEKTSVSVFSDFASDSAYICELPALPAFDLSIDIDFEAYTIDFEVVVQSSVTSRQKMQLSSFRGLALRNISFGWSRCCTNSVGSRTSVSICTSVSDVTSTSTVTSIECATTTVEDIDFYGGEQSLCSPVDVNVDAVLDSVVLIDASILIAGLIKPINNSVWMSLLGSIEYLAPKPKHKGLSKVKIKTIQESEHIESRSHQIVAGIFAGFTY